LSKSIVIVSDYMHNRKLCKLQMGPGPGVINLISKLPLHYHETTAAHRTATSSHTTNSVHPNHFTCENLRRKINYGRNTFSNLFALFALHRFHCPWNWIRKCGCFVSIRSRSRSRWVVFCPVPIRRSVVGTMWLYFCPHLLDHCSWGRGRGTLVVAYWILGCPWRGR